MKKLLIIIILSLSSSGVLFAQDKITTLNNEVLSVKITEKSDYAIKYVLADGEQFTIFKTRLSKLKKIEYSNGMIDNLGYQNPHMQKRFGFDIGISKFIEDGGFFSFGVDYFINPNLNIILNVGKDGNETYTSTGFRYFTANRNNLSGFSPYVGLLYGVNGNFSYLEVPVGLHYQAKCGFQTSIQISAMDYFNSNYEIVRGEFRLGWRF